MTTELAISSSKRFESRPGSVTVERATKLLMRIAGARAGIIALAIAACFACTSPTLPLPPPTAPTISIGSEPNTFRLKSERGAIPNALIVVVSRNPNLSSNQRVEGTIADTQGSWELDVMGTAGDIVDISQEDGVTRSPATTVTLK
jgi:hypothetical protein